MQVRHDTTLLRQAIELVNRRAEIPTLRAVAAVEASRAEAAEKIASAEEARSRATSRMRLASGAAIALAAVGIGLAVNFANSRQIERVAGGSISQSPVVQRTVEEFPRPVSNGVTTTNYTKFVTRDVTYKERTWTIEAGHFYSTETQKDWERAWCYTSAIVDGVSIRVELAHRNVGAAQPEVPATEATLEAAHLTRSDANSLASDCPWLD